MALIYFLVFASTFADDMILTPFGLARTATCVIEVASGAMITTTDGITIGVENPADGTSTPTNVDPACDTDGFPAAVLANSKEMQQAALAASNLVSFLETKQFPMEHWIDNAGSFPLGRSATADIPHFKATYTVPQNPTKTTGCLFYFIGLQNDDDQFAVDPDPANFKQVSILQPVLQWSCNGFPGWQLANWNCCPRNVTHHSTLVAVNAGDSIDVSISRDDKFTWTITGSDHTTGASTTLLSQIGKYHYDWADVTMEVYHVNSCDEFPASGVMTFSGVELKDASGNALTPSWNLSPASGCGGSITKTSATSFDVKHDSGLGSTSSQSGVGGSFRSTRDDHSVPSLRTSHHGPLIKPNLRHDQQILRP